jgi:hypothetical protein
MAVTFNAFNPMTWWTAPLGGRVSVFPADRTPASAPIAIDARASDPGMQVRAGTDRLVISGTASGPQPMRDIFGLPHGDLARSDSFTLDIDKAPTRDVWGNTDYSEKNSRIFTVMTSKGATALQVAEALAKKVNRGDDFRATVTPQQDGSAELTFARR